MRQIFFTVTKIQIIITLGYVLCMGLYAGADPSQASEKTEDASAIVATPEVQKSSEDSPQNTEKDKNKSNDNQAEAAKKPATKTNETANTEQDKNKSNDNQAEAAKKPATKTNETANTEQDKSHTKQDNNQIKKIQKPELFVNQVPHYHQSNRNGFFTFYAIPSYIFFFNNFSLLIHAGLGKMIHLPKLIPNGILEWEMGFNWFIMKGEQILNLQVKKEVNFMKNDGTNSLVPGMDLPISLNIENQGRSFAKLSFNIGTGVYLKAFVSKNFALIPRFGVNLNLHQSTGFGYALGPAVSMELGIGFRRYF